MKNIRIGKDIVAKWPILTNGVATSLVGRDLTLHLITPTGKKIAMPFSVDGNVVVFRYRGIDHERTGNYSLTLWENLGKDGQTVVDKTDAFCLVSRTEKEGMDTEGLETYVLELEGGDLQLGVAGKDGKDGKDGYTPIKGVDYFDGKDGADGKDGRDGYTPIKGVDYFDGADGRNGKDGINGRDGADGYTPVKGVDYFDGADGKDGRDGVDGRNGADGADGVGIASVEQIAAPTESGAENIARITLTNGVHQDFIVRNGQRGEKGEQGEKGEMGEQGPAVDISGKADKAELQEVNANIAAIKGEIGDINTLLTNIVG